MPTTTEHPCNPRLVPWKRHTVENEAGTGFIEMPGMGENIRWQSRSAEPTAFETALGDAIEQLYFQGLSTSAEFAGALNRMGLRSPSGTLWDVARLEREMARLGA